VDLPHPAVLFHLSGHVLQWVQ